MNQFLQDVIKGLSTPAKYLESKYFYDSTGDDLFKAIMACPEYYPTKCELEIFTEQKTELANSFIKDNQPFDVVELGAGDATKSKHLLQELMHQNKSFTYYPVDISQNIINELHENLPKEIPGLIVEGLNGEYISMLEKANGISDRKKVVLFLGSNIGNVPLNDAHKFCDQMRSHLKKGDELLLGIDLKKDPHTIRAAYNDKSGFTRDFNLNLLRRINRELGGNFNIENFQHYPSYDPETGASKSFLISTQDQVVTLGGQTFHFDKYEPIFMEISQKYTVAQTDQLAHQSGYKPVSHFFDSKHWFLDTIWECV